MIIKYDPKREDRVKKLISGIQDKTTLDLLVDKLDALADIDESNAFKIKDIAHLFNYKEFDLYYFRFKIHRCWFRLPAYKEKNEYFIIHFFQKGSKKMPKNEILTIKNLF